MRAFRLLPGLFSLLLASPTPAAEVALFNGRDLAGWKDPEFSGGAAAVVEGGILRIGQGEVLSGLVYTNDIPRLNYEIEVEARRVLGTDFFLALTAPHGTNCFTLVCGGWGGWVTGISSLNYLDASENDTAVSVKYEDNRWYKVRLRVEPNRLAVWMDGDPIIDADIEGRHIGMRPGDIEKCAPLGLATYQTQGEIRRLVLRRLPPPATPPQPAP
jgi:hypothetical protein